MLLAMLFSSYTMGTSGLPDIYTQSPRAEGVYIRQTTRAHHITIMYHSVHYHAWANAKQLKPLLSITLLYL